MAATITGKHKTVAMILLLVLGPASPTFYATRGQDERPESDTAIRKGLRLSAELRTHVFTPDSSMAVKLRLQNTSKSLIDLHTEIGGGPGGFYVTIFDAQNSRRLPNMIAESFPPPLLSIKDLQAIPPGKSLDYTLELPLSRYELTPGEYTLWIDFTSPVPKSEVTKVLNVLTSSDGPLSVKPIHFKVQL
jgi:hypothetical protein